MRRSIRVSVLLVVGLLLLAGACSSNGGSDDSCDPGLLNCVCLAGDRCDGELICVEGFCVEPATECPEGSKGCPCYSNGTCDSRDGQPMECVENVCQLPGEEDLGGLDDPCDAENPCGVHEGTQLECVEGICQLPDEPCEPGTLDCPCEDGACDPGLECLEDVCQAAAGSGIRVTNPEVRACDVLLELRDADVQFGAVVKGTSARKGDMLAFSFVAMTDASFDEMVGALVEIGTEEPDLDGLIPTRVECFDRLGVIVDEPGFEFK